MKPLCKKCRKFVKKEGQNICNHCFNELEQIQQNNLKIESLEKKTGNRTENLTKFMEN